MKNFLLLTYIFFSVNFLSAQEAFYIENYHVDIQLHTNGSFDVTETIDVFFTEERRGIIRDIPCRYVFDTITAQNRHKYAFGANSYKEYQILIDSIDVEDDEFTVTDNGYNKSIRIGSYDKFISGAHKYVIKYTVWGAINEFTDHSEFAWNVIGHEWKTKIQKASFSLTLQDQTKMSDEDVKVFSGFLGNQDSSLAVKYNFNSKHINGETNDTLQEGQGLTLIIRLPADYFNNRYRIKKHIADFYLEKDGSYISSNIQFVEYNGYQQYVLNKLPVTSPEKREHKYHVSYKYNHLLTENQLVFVNGTRSYATSFLKGQDAKWYRYTLLNGKTDFKNGEGLLWRWDMRQYYQKFDTLLINFELLKHAQPISVEFTKNGKPTDFKLDGNEFSAEIVNMKPKDIFELKVVYPKWTYSAPLPPKPKIYDLENLFVISRFDDEIFINNDATVKIKRKYYVDFRDKIPTGFTFPVSMNISDVGRYFHGYFSENHHFIIEDIKSADVEFLRSYPGYEINFGKNKGDGLRKKTFAFEYTTYNMLRKDKGEFYVNIPLYEGEELPVVKGTVRIHFPKEINREKIIYDLKNEYQKVPDFEVNENSFRDSVLQLDFKQKYDVSALPDRPLLKLRFPKGNIKTTFTKDSKIFYAKYEDEILSLVVPLALTFVLFVLWFFIGRDKKQEVVEKYYLPENISPPEVGFIWDGKLHKRDLVALIYHWAAKGYLKISGMNDDKKDLILTKLKDLPKNESKNFERTIFQGLFKSRDAVTTDTLRDSFYTTMNYADKQFKKYNKNKRLIVPGTKAFGKILMILGIVIGAITFFVGLVYTSTFIMTYALFLAAPFLIFGKIMPRFGYLGRKMYYEVLGFRRFIEEAKVDRLMFLLEENPDYFDQTIAYAIVMGMGRVWADKFNGLIKAKPIKEKGASGEKNIDAVEEKMDTLFYVDTIIKRMHKIEEDFHYKKPPARSSYSSGSSTSYSYKSSGSYSFGSSSSYGGSSSYGSSSSSSGYSGSGYGGGGGSSW